jgi:hypothetical protein
MAALLTIHDVKGRSRVRVISHEISMAKIYADLAPMCHALFLFVPAEYFYMSHPTIDAVG